MASTNTVVFESQSRGAVHVHLVRHFFPIHPALGQTCRHPLGSNDDVTTGNAAPAVEVATATAITVERGHEDNDLECVD